MCSLSTWLTWSDSNGVIVDFGGGKVGAIKCTRLLENLTACGNWRSHDRELNSKEEELLCGFFIEDGFGSMPFDDIHALGLH